MSETALADPPFDVDESGALAPSKPIVIPRDLAVQTVSTLLAMPGYAGYLLLKEWEPYAPELYQR